MIYIQGKSCLRRLFGKSNYYCFINMMISINMVLNLNNNMLELYRKEPEKVLRIVRKAVKKYEKLDISSDIDYKSNEYNNLMKNIHLESEKYTKKLKKIDKKSFRNLSIKYAAYFTTSLLLGTINPLIGLFTFGTMYFGEHATGFCLDHYKSRKNTVLSSYLTQMQRFINDKNTRKM